jgi:O-antigen/teichoic acid export membrane protein
MPPLKPTLFLARQDGIIGNAKQFLRLSAVRDIGALGLGALLSQTIFFLAAPAFLRLYQPGDFGLYSFYYGLLTLLATLGTWKIERLIVVVHRKSAAIRLFAALILIAAAASIFLLVLIGLMYLMDVQRLPEMAKIFPLVWFAPAWMFIQLVTMGLRSYSIRIRKFWTVAAGQILRAVLFAIGTIATAIIWKASEKNGALVMLFCMMIADTCALIVQIWTNSRTVHLVVSRPRVRKSWIVLLKHVKTIGALAASQSLAAVYQQMPISTAALAFGAVPAGWYSLGNVFIAGPSSVITSAVGEVVNQRLSRLFASRKPFSFLVLRIAAMMAGVGLLFFMTLGIVASSRLLPAIFGLQWLDASPTILILLISSYLAFVRSPGSGVALIVDAHWYILIWNALRTVCLAGLGTAAVLGLISYMTWLALMVAVDSIFYIVDILTCFFFARTVERVWC